MQFKNFWRKKGNNFDERQIFPDEAEEKTSQKMLISHKKVLSLDSIKTNSYNQMDARLTKCSWVIHLFALGHAVASFVMVRLGMNDEILLSLLTISMIILVTHFYGIPLEVSAALAALCCFAGFYLGTLGGEWLNASEVELLIRYDNEITTFVVTEILGWSTTLIAARRGK